MTYSVSGTHAGLYKYTYIHILFLNNTYIIFEIIF